MDRRSRSLLTRIGIGLAGLTTAAAIAVPLHTSKPEEVHSRPVSHVNPAPQDAVTPADSGSGCVTVDANGVPLYDSQYGQRTGHPPC
jgi:hypothetical protein